MVYTYMIKVYAYLVKSGKRLIETLPVNYQLPVAELLATESEV